MEMTRPKSAALFSCLCGALAMLYYFFREPPLTPDDVVRFIRPTVIQLEYVQKCELQINGQDFETTKHIIPRNSDVHVTGLIQYDPQKIAYPAYAPGIMTVACCPKGTSERGWRAAALDASLDNEWEGGQMGTVDYVDSVESEPGEYELRAYVFMDIRGMETAKLEYVLKGEAVITE